MACLLAIQRVKIFSVGARAVGEEEAQPRWIRVWPCYYCCLFGVCACVCLYYFFHLTSTDPVALPAHWPIFISDGRGSPFTPNSRRPTDRASARARLLFFLSTRKRRTSTAVIKSARVVISLNSRIQTPKKDFEKRRRAELQHWADRLTFARFCVGKKRNAIRLRKIKDNRPNALVVSCND